MISPVCGAPLAERLCSARCRSLTLLRCTPNIRARTFWGGGASTHVGRTSVPTGTTRHPRGRGFVAAQKRAGDARAAPLLRSRQRELESPHEPADVDGQRWWRPPRRPSGAGATALPGCMVEQSKWRNPGRSSSGRRSVLVRPQSRSRGQTRSQDRGCCRRQHRIVGRRRPQCGRNGSGLAARPARRRSDENGHESGKRKVAAFRTRVSLSKSGG